MKAIKLSVLLSFLLSILILTAVGCAIPDEPPQQPQQPELFTIKNTFSGQIYTETETGCSWYVPDRNETTPQLIGKCSLLPKSQQPATPNLK